MRWRTIGSWLALGLVVVCWAARAAAADRPTTPNVVIIFTDDQGYGDVGCYGAKGFKTPNLDRMAAEGMRFTSFYVAQAVCSASRTALLTGCYPNRVGILGALGPANTHGISDSEMLLPEVFKQKGYATAIFGKWHLGHHPKFLPTKHGFDEYFGLPYSNDMWPEHPQAKNFPPLPLIENDKVKIEKVTAADQKNLTTWYTERAVSFIEKNKDRPFFLYVPHSMPHVPLFTRDESAGKAEQGRYGDVIQEIDAGVGEMLAAIKKNGLDENTLVIFTTDNGPWLSYGDHAGSAGPLREGKGTMWEGGVRVPCIMRWPGQIPAGKVQDEMAATIDILPTMASLIGAKLPEHKIDGVDLWPLLSGDETARPRETYHYYWGTELQAVRHGKWKLHFPHEYRSLTGKPGRNGQPNGYSNRKCGLELYDLEADIGETKNVADDHPEVVKELQSIAESARDDLGDSLQKKPGKNVRQAGKL